MELNGKMAKNQTKKDFVGPNIACYNEKNSTHEALVGTRCAKKSTIGGCVFSRASPPNVSTQDQPRERLFLVGEEGLSDSEILALILGTSGVRGRDVFSLARQILRVFGGIWGLAYAGIHG